MNRILIKNIDMLLEDGNITHGSIAIEDSIIKYVGQVPPEWKENTVIDGVDLFVIPGLINTHTHAAMTLFRSYADDMLLMDWLENKIWPVERNLTAEDIYWGSMLAIAEMIKSGTTTFADMYFAMPEVAKAVAESGMRAVLARGIAGVAPNAQQALEESKTFFQEYHETENGRIRVMLGPHAPYTCPPAYLKSVVNIAQQLGAEIHIHLAETANEVDNCIKEYGKTPIALMDEVGLLECGVLAAHCVHLASNDIMIMRDKNVRVAHNPGSNLKLASGIAPVPELLAAGVVVGLGTDGAASNNNLDLLEEVRLAALIHKNAKADPLVVPAAAAVNMGTKLGAAALGLGNSVGKIVPGMKADLTLFNTKKLHWYPRHDKLSLLVYAASAADVDTVLVDGKILLRNGILTTIDEEKLINEVQTRAIRLTK